METKGRKTRSPTGSFFLFGPRGTGKTTWLRQNYPDALWLDLLDPRNQRSYLARPERLNELLAGNPTAKIVIIDEIQKVPALLDVVHQIVETDKARRFILTGSSARKLRRDAANLLAGRLIRAEEVAGTALEGLVAQHLRAWIAHRNAGDQLYYWRTKSGSEVDFIVYGPDTFNAWEVKHAAKVHTTDLRSLKTFREDYPEAQVAMLYMGQERLEIEGIPVIPCGEFLRGL